MKYNRIKFVSVILILVFLVPNYVLANNLDEEAVVKMAVDHQGELHGDNISQELQRRIIILMEINSINDSEARIGVFNKIEPDKVYPKYHKELGEVLTIEKDSDRTDKVLKICSDMTSYYNGIDIEEVDEAISGGNSFIKLLTLLAGIIISLFIGYGISKYQEHREGKDEQGESK